MSQNRTASSLRLPWLLIYSSVLLAVIFYAVHEVLVEMSRLMTTNVPWVESVLVIAAFMFVGILAILVLLGLLAKSIKRG